MDNKLEDIFKNIKQVIVESIGVDENEVKLETTLFDELEVDSIDMIDILYELESMYEVTLKVSDIENKAKAELGDIPFEIDGIITKEGLEILKLHMTEIDESKITEGLTIHKLIQLFTVHSFCKIVLFRIENKD